MVRWVLLFTLLSLLCFSGCQSSSDINRVVLADENFYTLVAEDVIFMDGHDVIFMSPRGWQGMPPHTLSITKATFRGGNVSGAQIYHLEEVFSTGWPVIAFDNDDNFFIPLSVIYNDTEKQRIVRFSSLLHIRDGYERDGNIIRETTGAFYTNFFITDDYMIIFEPSFENQHFIYRVMRHHMINGYEGTIIDKTFSRLTGYGEIIVNIFVENNTLFLFRINITSEGVRDFFIDEYDLYGNKLRSLCIEINEFLYMHEVSDEDSITGILKFKNYFILSTIHNRIAIFKMENNNFIRIDTPSIFLNIGGVILIDRFLSDVEMLYFWDLNNKIYIFDPTNGELCSVEIVKEIGNDFPFIEDIISNIHRDAEGNILVQVRVDMNAWERHREEERRRLEARGEFAPMGDGFPRGSSLFYWIGREELKRR